MGQSVFSLLRGVKMCPQNKKPEEDDDERR